MRIELWGDEIDTLSFFDIQTQRRTDAADEVLITPASEVLPDSAEALVKAIESLAKKTKHEKAAEHLRADADRLTEGLALNSFDRYLSLIYSAPGTLFDYMKLGTVFVCEYASIREKAKTYLWQQEEDIKELLEEGVLVRACTTAHRE